MRAAAGVHPAQRTRLPVKKIRKIHSFKGKIK
jgi:hypothetical protein